MLHHENHSPQDPDIGTVRSINFPRLRRATTFDDRARRFRPTSASSYRTPCTTCGKGIGEVLCLGTLNTLCLKRCSPVDRSNSCSLSSPSFLPRHSSFADPKVRVVLSLFSMHIFYYSFIETVQFLRGATQEKKREVSFLYKYINVRK